jgi:teichuronic acid biosynthesis glycosyltransferase TuaH
MRILYMMHVDWDWIKQRPQYLAETLSKDNEIYVLYDKNYKKKRLSYNERVKKFIIKPYYRLPGEFQHKAISWVNKTSRALTVKAINKRFNSNVIWISYPTMIASIPKGYEGLVLYDCMDDHVAMASSEAKEMIRNLEKQVVERADIVLFSSKQLRKSVLERYQRDVHRTYIVRNGYLQDDFIASSTCKIKKGKGIINLCYFGTISSWFDWNTIKYTINQFEGVYVHIIGPISNGPDNFEHPQIIFHGPINHSQLKSYVSEMDCFIMPFLIDDIILAVDPVKLYEYLLFGKNIITSSYPEIDRFSDFAYFYHNKEEFANIVKGLLENKNKLKYTSEQASTFLSVNTWNARAEQVNEILKRYV